MAEQKKKRRVVKQPETVRQQREKAASSQPKKRRVRQTAKKATTPFRFIGRLILKVLRPFRFLLAPFRTRPVRFIGRIVGKILFISYFINSWRELRQVTWPKRGETLKLTLAVFVFAAAIAGFVAILDYALDKIFKQLLT